MNAYIAAFVLMLSAPLAAETRGYMIEMHNDRGRLVATRHLQLELGPEGADAITAVSGTSTADRVEDAYHDLLGGTEEVTGQMGERHLRLTLSVSIFGPPLRIEAVAIPDHPGAFHGRWRRFDCFRGAAGTLTIWPIRPGANR